MTRRQRPDGTFTYATPEHDAQWYWPVGTRVSVPFRDGPHHATVSKRNAVSVWLRFDDGQPDRKVEVRLLTRLAEPLTPRWSVCSDSPACAANDCPDCQRSYGPPR